MRQFLKFIFEGNSTCFGQFFCPSSGVFHCMHSNGIGHTDFSDSLQAGSGWNSSFILILLASCQKNLEFHPDPACRLSEKPVWHIPLVCVQWKTPDDGQRNSPKHVEFPSKVNLRNWCIWLVYYRKFVTMHGHINVKNIRNPCDLMWTQFTDVMGVSNTREHVERVTVTPF